MTVTIAPGKISGGVSAIPSKSHVHRLLICAALADRETFVVSGDSGAQDIEATIACLGALGAQITRSEGGFTVVPINRRNSIPPDSGAAVILPCGESGSTLRFLLPVVCALGASAAFRMEGRLPQRPLAPLDAELQRGGIRLWREGADILRCEGRLSPSNYHLSGDVSSQYISGLLFTLPLLDAPSRLTVAHPVESADYIAMTLEALDAFGRKPTITEHCGKAPNETWYDSAPSGAFISPRRIAAEGDWSNAAFWLCAGAMPGGDVQVSGLKQNSAQGDREVCAILARMGAQVNWEGGTLRVREGRRLGTEIDARAIPDLVPVLAAVAAVAEGTTVIRNAARLRLKESDRLATTTATLTALGADITETEDSLVIEGRRHLNGGAADAAGDHRIAMMAAIASAACAGTVRICCAQAVNKSYPAFWSDCAALGKTVKVEE